MKKEDVDKMTLQEACDYAVTKIVQQGGQCLGKNNSCAYGNNNGRHCAIGWLLDENNDDLMRHEKSIYDLYEIHYSKIPKLICDSLYIFRYLQSFHDSLFQTERRIYLSRLSTLIDTTTNPCYQQWVEMGF